MKHINKITTGLVLALGIGMVTTAFTSEGGMAGCNRHVRGGLGQGHMDRHSMNVDKAASHVEGRLAFLKAELKLSAGQEAAWQVFAEKYREQKRAWQVFAKNHHTEMAQMREYSGDQDPHDTEEAMITAPQRFERQTQHMEQRLSSTKQMSKMVAALYSELSLEQKAVADQIFAGSHF